MKKRLDERKNALIASIALDVSKRVSYEYRGDVLLIEVRTNKL